MGPQSLFRPSRFCWSALILWVFALAAGALRAQGTPGALVVPLARPMGLVYDAQGNLLIADQAAQVIDRVTPQGAISVYAGTGTEGYSGDGGPATAATLNGPGALAIDAQADVFLADIGNHVIRRVDAKSGVISTLVQVGRPSALLLDGAGNLIYADAALHQIRRFNLQTGVNSLLAGTGVEGSAGDGGQATAATLSAPAALAQDAAGNLYFSDERPGAVRRIDAVTGVISLTAQAGAPRGLAFDPQGVLILADPSRRTIQQLFAGRVLVGTGVQAFGGDGGPASGAFLNDPEQMTYSPAGLLTFSDTGNGRVRQVDANGVIHTIAGLGAGAGVTLAVAAPSVVLYGTGTLSASLTASAASGTVTLLEMIGETGSSAVATATLSGNAASFPLGRLSAGPHRLFVTYAGDAAHGSAVSPVVSVGVSPAALQVAPNPISILYGQGLPVLSGTVTGLLAQDAGAVGFSYGSGAGTLSPPGSYPITAVANGSLAANYALTVQPAAVTILKAPASLTLSSQTSARLVSTTSGHPTGTVLLLDGTAQIAAGTASGSGDVSFPAASLSAGTHTLSASYAGDADFLPAAATPLLVTISPVASPDFTLASAGSATATVPAGTAAQFAFTVAPVNGALSSPILLAASGLPNGATASFNPAYLPPSGVNSAFVLTIQTPHAALATGHLPYWLALLIPLVWMRRLRQRVLICAPLVGFLLIAGCGDRINHAADTATASRSYNITVTGTATQPSGATVQHSAVVTLVVQ